jgi:hypothetical protein
MSEDVNGGESPHEYAGTNRLESIRVPAPRLELQSGSLNNLRSILCELAKNAKLEMKRGNKGAVEELLQVFIESGEKFSTFEKNILENGKRSEPFAKGGKGSAPFAGFSKGLPFVAEGSQ